MNLNKIKIGIALSGGGARGAAHIGVLKALKEAGIVAHEISGSSAGAIVGAMYAAGLPYTTMIDLISHTSLLKMFHLQHLSNGLAQTRYLSDLMREHIKPDDFGGLKRKLYVGASNLNKGRFEILESGRLSTAVAASCAVPLLFQPVFIGKDMFVDGGLFNNLPIEPLQINCTHIIGVSVNPHKELHKLQGMSAIGHRCFELLTWNNNHGRMDLCDLQIELKSISTYHLFDFSKADELFTSGYSETKEIIKNLDFNF